ncbi:MAG: hypothetical protein B7Y02_02115 [Rhodobacterales bacterium 17-64-5]|nr:MAG: hypothetical protein B7Y02_02115 [Rhodobacterales bacterium 17-64-5]
MSDLVLSPSLKAAIAGIVTLLETDQPTGLVVDEIVRSSRIVDSMVPGGALDLAVREAERRFSDADFWTSPPERLARLVELVRSQVRAARTEAMKHQVLIDLLVQKRPTFLLGAS